MNAFRDFIISHVKSGHVAYSKKGLMIA